MAGKWAMGQSMPTDFGSFPSSSEAESRAQLDADIKAFGKNAAPTLISKSSLAMHLGKTDPEAALKMQKKVLEGKLKLLKVERKYEEAIEYLQKALAIRERIQRDERDAAITRDELGCCYQCLGQTEKAREIRLKKGLAAVICINEPCSRTAKDLRIASLQACGGCKAISSWPATILPIQADNTFSYEWQPPSPDTAPASPSPELETSSPSPTVDDSPIPPEYLPKPPDVFPESIDPPLPPASPSLPRWVLYKTSRSFMKEYHRNKDLIAAIDNSGNQADVLVYGDSITALNKPTNLNTGIKGSRVPWDRNFGDLHAEPLGIPSDRIGNLMWRLAVGDEKPTYKDPKVVVIFIGINDCRDRTPTLEIASRMEFLLKWVRQNMPKSKIVVQALLPGLSQAEEVNIQYAKLAKKYGLTFSTCGRDIKKGDKKYMADKLHPNVNGQNVWLQCLRKVVQPMLK